MNRFGSILILLFLFPQFIHANVQITEIMYDLPGADTKREWVKIYNSGSSETDLTDWRFHDGSNHTLNIPPENGGQGDIVLEPNESAYLVSNAETFLSENTTTLSVIDTVMSLNNTTDTLTLYDGEGTLMHQVTYTSDQGGAGDGNPLVLGNPIPKPEDEDEEVVPEIPVPEVLFDPHVNPDLEVDAGSDLFGVAGERLVLNGIATGSKGEMLKNARYVWNIGNQDVVEGKSVSHTFMYPGTHSIILTVANGRFSASDQVVARVRTPNISFSTNEFGASLINQEQVLLNISNWILRNGTSSMVFPDESYLFPNNEVFIPLLTKEQSISEFLLPNGVAIATSSWKRETEPEIIEKIVEIPKVVEKIVYVESEIEEEVVEPVATSVASVFVRPVVEEESSFYPWLLGLLVLITLGGFAGVIQLSEKQPLEPADEYEISSSEKIS